MLLSMLMKHNSNTNIVVNLNTGILEIISFLECDLSNFPVHES